MNDKLNRIKEVIDQQGTSQADLSRGIGVTKNAINALCSNSSQPSLKRLYAISDYLNVPAYTLIADYNPKTIKQEMALQILAEFIDKDIIDEIKDKMGEDTPNE